MGWTMTIGSTRRIGRGAVLALLLAVSPAALAAQTAPEESFLRALGDHYDLPEAEIDILAEWRIPVREIPVALAIADRAAISPDAIVAARRNGRAWSAVAARYGLDMAFFHVPLEPVPQPLTSLYAELDTRPRQSWNEVTPGDDAVVFLTNVRFLHEYLGVTPSRASEALMAEGSPAEALRVLSS